MKYLFFLALFTFLNLNETILVSNKNSIHQEQNERSNSHLLDSLIFRIENKESRALITARRLLNEIDITTQPPEQQAFIFLQLGLGFYNGNVIDSSKVLLEQAVDLAEELALNDILKQAYYQLGVIANNRRLTSEIEKYNDKLLELAVITQDKEYLAKANWLKSMIFEYGGLYDSAQVYHEKAESISLLNGDTTFYYHILLSKSILLSSLEKYSEALVMLDSVEDYHVKKGDIQTVSDVRLNMASLFNRIGQTEKAIDLYFKVLPEYSKRETPGRYPALLANLGLAYEKVGDNKRAREYYLKALEDTEGSANIACGVNSLLGDLAIENGNLVQAENYLNKALKIAKEENIVRRKTTIYFYLGDLFDAKYDIDNIDTFLDSAVYYLKRSIDQYEAIGSTYGKYQAQVRLSELLIKNQSFYEAENLLLDVEQKAIETENIALQRVCFLTLSALYREKKNFKLADQYNVKYLELLEKEKEEELYDRLLEKDYYYRYLLQIKQDSIKNNYLIKDKIKQLSEKETAIKRHNIILAAIAIVLIFTITLLYFLRKRNRQLIKARKLIDHQKKETEQQRDELKQTLSELRETQQKLIESAKLSAVDSLSESMAHEIKNPLYFIKGSTFALKKLLNQSEIGSSAKIQRIMIDIGESADRINFILEGLARYNASHMLLGPGKVNQVVDQTVSQISRSQSAAVDFQVDHEKSVTAIFDQTFLEQALICILVNSIEAMPAGGTVSICVEQRNTKCVISIKDDGVGMNEETLSKAFEPFFSTKTEVKGVGLGLFTAYSVVTEMGGELTLKSAPGKGTNAEIKLNINDKQL